MHISDFHAERRHGCPLCPINSLDQAFLIIFIHQEADGAAVHAIDWLVVLKPASHRVEHGSIATERHNDVGFVFIILPIFLGQALKRFLGFWAL